LVGKPGGSRALGRLGNSWDDNIKMGRREMGWKDVNSINLAEDGDQWQAFVNTVMILQVA
jgi:hypothetical protein